MTGGQVAWANVSRPAPISCLTSLPSSCLLCFSLFPHQPLLLSFCLETPQERQATIHQRGEHLSLGTSQPTEPLRMVELPRGHLRYITLLPVGSRELERGWLHLRSPSSESVSACESHLSLRKFRVHGWMRRRRCEVSPRHRCHERGRGGSVVRNVGADVVDATSRAWFLCFSP